MVAWRTPRQTSGSAISRPEWPSRCVKRKRDAPSWGAAITLAPGAAAQTLDQPFVAVGDR